MFFISGVGFRTSQSLRDSSPQKGALILFHCYHGAKVPLQHGRTIVLGFQDEMDGLTTLGIFWNGEGGIGTGRIVHGYFAFVRTYLPLPPLQ